MEQPALDKNTFERELEMCRKFSKENGGNCNWGICENCGVIPLLYKLRGGILLEKNEDIKGLRDKILS